MAHCYSATRPATSQQPDMHVCKLLATMMATTLFGCVCTLQSNNQEAGFVCCRLGRKSWTGVQGLVQIAIVGSRRGDSRAHARVTTDEMQGMYQGSDPFAPACATTVLLR